MNYTVEPWDKVSPINGCDASRILGHNPEFNGSKCFVLKSGEQAVRVECESTIRSNYGVGDSMTSEELYDFYLKQYLKDTNPDTLLSELELKRKEVLQAVADRDKASDVFFVQIGSGEDAPRIPMWIPAQLRTQLLTNTLPAQKLAGNEIVNLWTETTPPVKLPIQTQWGIDNMPRVEVYAMSTLDALKQNQYKAETASSVEELGAIDTEEPYADITPVTLVLPVEDMPEWAQEYYAGLASQIQI